ncbi:MAG TPA: hypothetical protein VIM61_02335 [Chthoniobacterales bacterium]|jgi:hypothetical protein
MSANFRLTVGIPRKVIEALDIELFLNQFAPANLPRGRELADLMGGVEVMPLGYPDDAGAFYEIPEVRKFFQELHAAWPYWLFFGQTETQTLRFTAACLFDNVTTVRQADRQRFQVVIQAQELGRFLDDCSLPFVELCTRANVGADAQKRRILGLFQYFQLL